LSSVVVEAFPGRALCRPNGNGRQHAAIFKQRIASFVGARAKMEAWREKHEAALEHVNIAGMPQ